MLASDRRPWPPRQIRHVGFSAPVRPEPSASNPHRAAFSSGAECVALPAPIAGALRVASPPCPGINECARTAAPRLPLSLARTRVARSFPREGQRGPWLAGEVEVCPCILKSRSGPRAFSLPLGPGDPRYSGQQVCCGSGRVRGESEQGPASRLRGTGSAGRRPRDARVYLSVASVAGVTLCCFQLSWSAPYLPRR